LSAVLLFTVTSVQRINARRRLEGGADVGYRLHSSRTVGFVGRCGAVGPPGLDAL